MGGFFSKVNNQSVSFQSLNEVSASPFLHFIVGADSKIKEARKHQRRLRLALIIRDAKKRIREYLIPMIERKNMVKSEELYQIVELPSHFFYKKSRRFNRWVTRKVREHNIKVGNLKCCIEISSAINTLVKNNEMITQGKVEFLIGAQPQFICRNKYAREYYFEKKNACENHHDKLGALHDKGTAFLHGFFYREG